jgi:hypothetical protein
MGAKKLKLLPWQALVAVKADLRRANAWFEGVVSTKKETAIEKRRAQERLRGQQLEPEKLIEQLDALDELQTQRNSIDNKMAEINAAILAHWGHTGVKELAGTSGKTLITTSCEIAVDPTVIRKAVNVRSWVHKLTDRILQPAALLAMARENTPLHASVVDAVRVKKLRVSIIPPSSRRPKSSLVDEEDGEEE